MVGGGDDGVVECGTAFGVDMRQALFEQADVGGKVLIEKGFVGKIHDERLVLWVRGTHKVDGGAVDGSALFLHGGGVVHQDGERYGHILLVKRRNRLRNAVFFDAEILLLQRSDQMLMAIDNSGVEDNLGDIGMQGKGPVRAGLHGLAGFAGGRRGLRFCGRRCEDTIEENRGTKRDERHILTMQFS
jgi:hypothetical protein